MQAILSYLRWLLSVWLYPFKMLLYAPYRFFSGPSRIRIPTLSLPFRVALLMFFVLLISVTVTVVLFCRMNNVTFREAKLNLTFWISTSLLVILIPLVLYKALKLWLEGPSSPYPDIDQAWKAGLKELKGKGLDLRQIPLFLVVGSSNEQQEQAIFKSAGTEFLVTGAPEGNSCLHWYANTDAVYVVASQVSCLSGLGRNRSPQSDLAYEQPVAAAAGQKAAPAFDPRQTIPVGGVSRQQPDPSEAAAPARPQVQAPSQPQMSNDLRGTIIGPPSGLTSSPPAGAPASDRNIQTDKGFFDDQRNRFGWLCRLIRRYRLPYAPINGVLAMLPFGYVQSAKPGVRKVLTDSLRFDLEQVLGALMIRCPVTVLITDMDEEPGFREFIRRMVRRQGPEWVKDRRFGSSFPLDIPATPDRVKKLSNLLSAAFEVWVYDFFHDEESILRSSANTSLYAFLGKVRQSVKNLATIFSSFSNLHPKAAAAAGSADVVYFAGCYFAGTGKVDERQVFVKRVLAKPIEQQEELEWTADAVREDGRYQWLGLVASTIDSILFLAFVVVGILWWLGYKLA